MTTRPRVVVAGTLPAVGAGLLEQRFAVEIGGVPADAAWLRAHAPAAAAIVADPTVAVDEELPAAAGDSLKVVASFGVGYDHIDADAAGAGGIRVTNTLDVLTNATAELAVTLMVAAARRVAEGDAIVRAQWWHGWGPEDFLGRELAGATVGLVGFGRIARRVAELLMGFGVRLLYTSRSPQTGLAGAERRELDELPRAADFVSVHVSLTEATRHLITRGRWRPSSAAPFSSTRVAARSWMRRRWWTRCAPVGWPRPASTCSSMSRTCRRSFGRSRIPCCFRTSGRPPPPQGRDGAPVRRECDRRFGTRPCVGIAFAIGLHVPCGRAVPGGRGAARRRGHPLNRHDDGQPTLGRIHAAAENPGAASWGGHSARSFDGGVSLFICRGRRAWVGVALGR
jgi:hypothetical protein